MTITDDDNDNDNDNDDDDDNSDADENRQKKCRPWGTASCLIIRIINLVYCISH